MGKVRRKFDLQFKIQVCQAIEAGTHTVLGICQEHQLQRPTVEAWVARYVSGALTAKSPNRESELPRENEKGSFQKPWVTERKANTSASYPVWLR